MAKTLWVEISGWFLGWPIQWCRFLTTGMRPLMGTNFIRQTTVRESKATLAGWSQKLSTMCLTRIRNLAGTSITPYCENFWTTLWCSTVFQTGPRIIPTERLTGRQSPMRKTQIKKKNLCSSRSRKSSGGWSTQLWSYRWRPRFSLHLSGTVRGHRRAWCLTGSFQKLAPNARQDFSIGIKFLCHSVSSRQNYNWNWIIRISIKDFFSMWVMSMSYY